MKIVLATHNAHKAAEFQRILAPLGIEAVAQDAAGVTIEAEETADSFAGNSRLKAEAVFAECGLATVADDSGLAVDALGGAPGVYSARYGEAEGIRGLDDRGRIALLLERMRDVPEGARAARFVCCLTLRLPGGGAHTFEGICEGTIARAPRGKSGFGYDPVFLVGERSFSELSPAEKDAISHRGRALRQLAAFLAARRELRGAAAEEKESAMLTGKHRAGLRGLANSMEVVLQVGKAGLQPTVLKQLNEALLARELVKGRVQENCPLSAREAATQLAEAAGCEVVQVIGSRFVLFKQNCKKPIYDLAKL